MFWRKWHERHKDVKACQNHCQSKWFASPAWGQLSSIENCTVSYNVFRKWHTNCMEHGALYWYTHVRDHDCGQLLQHHHHEPTKIMQCCQLFKCYNSWAVTNSKFTTLFSKIYQCITLCWCWFFSFFAIRRWRSKK